MLFPIADDNTGRTTTPVVNYVLIGINVLVFVFLQGFGSNDKFTYAFSTVPAEIISGRDIVTRPVAVENFTGQRIEMPGLQLTPIPVYLTLITSMFMHGGIAHIFGNMLFLWIFGDNIEDRLGHFRYLIFYFVCGIIAGLSHVFATAMLASDPSSLYFAFPDETGDCAPRVVGNADARICSHRPLVRLSIDQRTWRARQRLTSRRRRVRGAHWRLHRRTFVD